MSYFEIFEIKQLSEREAILRNVRVIDSTYTEVVAQQVKDATDKPTTPAVASKSSGR